jgi:hypothetical protein
MKRILSSKRPFVVNCRTMLLFLWWLIASHPLEIRTESYVVLLASHHLLDTVL